MGNSFLYFLFLLFVFHKTKVEISKNEKFDIEDTFTIPQTIPKRSNLEITIKLVQITKSDTIAIHPRFQNQMEWRNRCSLPFQGLTVHEIQDYYDSNCFSSKILRVII
jgi:hypothetical protein